MSIEEAKKVLKTVENAEDKEEITNSRDDDKCEEKSLNRKRRLM